MKVLVLKGVKNRFAISIQGNGCKQGIIQDFLHAYIIFS